LGGRVVDGQAAWSAHARHVIRSRSLDSRRRSHWPSTPPSPRVGRVPALSLVRSLIPDATTPARFRAGVVVFAHLPAAPHVW